MWLRTDSKAAKIPQVPARNMVALVIIYGVIASDISVGQIVLGRRKRQQLQTATVAAALWSLASSIFFCRYSNQNVH